MALKLYPLGIQTFSEIRNRNMLYVDKTAYVYSLAHTNGKFFFLSRPRRFGKSLLVSTLKSYFEADRELFEGLAIDKLEHEWAAYPVVQISMAGGKGMGKRQLLEYLDYLLNAEENKWSIANHIIKGVNNRLANLIRTIYDKTHKQVVLLIDEYDAPILDAMHNVALLEEQRNVMRNFYSPLKDCEPYLRFVFITGITKFSQVSIFSELNNVVNISMSKEYAGICGITSNELKEQMADSIALLAQEQQMTYMQTYDKLCEYYDGYHFSSQSPDMFNPYSLLCCFAEKSFGAYWFSSGTPTFLINMIRKFKVSAAEIGRMYAKASAFDAPTESMKTLTPLLYQSGYITIKDYDPETHVYMLDIPNKEIKVGLFESLLPNYVEAKYAEEGDVVVARMSAMINKDDMNGALLLLQQFFSTVPYCNNTHYEGHYQQVLFIIFTLLTNYVVNVEVHTPKGRVDVVIQTRSKLYVIEIKLNKDAKAAMNQIEINEYDKSFALCHKEVVRVGINFNSKTGNIDD